MPVCARLRSWKYSIFTIRDARVQHSHTDGKSEKCGEKAAGSYRPLYQPPFLHPTPFLIPLESLLFFLFLFFLLVSRSLSPFSSSIFVSLSTILYSASPCHPSAHRRFLHLIEELSYDDGKLEKWRYREHTISVLPGTSTKCTASVSCSWDPGG